MLYRGTRRGIVSCLYFSKQTLPKLTLKTMFSAHKLLCVSSLGRDQLSDSFAGLPGCHQFGCSRMVAQPRVENLPHRC